MNSIDISVDLEALPPRAIALTTDQVEQARQRSRSVADPTQQWQIYLNTLSLLGFEQWLNQRASDILVNQLQNSIMQSSATLPVVCNVIINGFKICLIPVESQPDEVEIPSIAIAAPEMAAHFYVAIAVYEEQSQIAIHSFLRHDQLTAQIQFLQPDIDNLYAIPISDFEDDLDRLLLYLRCSNPSAIPLPSNSLTANRQPLIANSYERTTPFINIRRWLQNELDEVAQQLSWVLLPPIAREGSLRIKAKARQQPSFTEDFDEIIKQLVRDGMTLPVDTRAAYQNMMIGTVAARLYAVAGAIITAEQPPEWSLLIILGPKLQRQLPRGTQLQVSDRTEVLVQQILSDQTEDGYLFAQIVGTWEEQFVVTLTVPDGATLTLPPFGFQAE